LPKKLLTIFIYYVNAELTIASKEVPRIGWSITSRGQCMECESQQHSGWGPQHRDGPFNQYLDWLKQNTRLKLWLQWIKSILRIYLLIWKMFPRVRRKH
jgi:hypothetical protein